MKKTAFIRLLSLLLVAMVLLTGCVRPELLMPTQTEAGSLSEAGTYSSKEEVAANPDLHKPAVATPKASASH